MLSVGLGSCCTCMFLLGYSNAKQLVSLKLFSWHYKNNIKSL